MARRPIDEIFEGLGIPSERDLAKRRHRQQPAKRVECFLFKDRIFFVKVLAEPVLQSGKQRDIGIE